jgi:phosphoribosylformimino-5-aminoimidazole carboxamide ribotide isomerase
MIDIIPAIDLIGGKCVRLTQGDYNQKKIYNDNPLDVARQFEDMGVRRLHLVDLEGAKEKRVVNYPVLELITKHTKLELDFGGGIKSDEDLQKVFDSGAAMATIGSVAVTHQELFLLWLEKWGSERIILGADSKNRKIAITGWLEDTSVDLFDFMQMYFDKGVRKFLCTDISRDGMLTGTAIDLYREMRTRFPEAYLIASGGLASATEISELADFKMNAAIVGKAWYEGKITETELKKFL